MNCVGYIFKGYFHTLGSVAWFDEGQAKTMWHNKLLLLNPKLSFQQNGFSGMIEKVRAETGIFRAR